MSSRIHLLTRRGTAALAQVVLLGQLSPALAIPSAPSYRPNGTTTSSPVVAMVSPDHAPNSGASGVVITGSNFAGATQVLFGPSAVSFTVDSDSQITASLGAVSTTGWVDVSVSTPCGTGTLVHAFDYFQPPRRQGDGSCVTIDWSGSPTLGQSYTITAPSLSGCCGIKWLRVRWSLRASKPTALKAGVGCTFWGFRATQGVALVGSPPSHTFQIPNDVSLIGVHLQTQAASLPFMSSSGPKFSPVLDAVIGE